MARHRFRVLVIALAGALSLSAVAPLPAGAEPDPQVVHRPPVDAPVVDAFRPPTTAWGAGNRGLTYDLAPGTAVRATADGEVVFAGQVGGTLHVTIRHADGLRTSYSFLDRIVVRRGRRVAGGDPIGAGGLGFHLGARVGDTYIDPAALFASVRIEVRLVPHIEPLPPTDDGLLRERLALSAIVRDRSILQRFGAWAVEQGSAAADALRAGVHLGASLDPRRAGAEAVAAVLQRVGEPCTPSETAVTVPDTAGRVALLVGGLGSSSTEAAIDDVDVVTLGYLDDDVVRFSYAGGRIPDPDGSIHPSLADMPANHYGPADTGADIEAQGHALAELVLGIAGARPGDRIDLYAHSLGGLVTRVALLELQHHAGALDDVGVVVTIGTPNRGADIATGVPPMGIADQLTLDTLGPLVGFEIDQGAPALRQLAETSALVRRLADEGVPDGVDFRTVGARGDLVVTADKAAVDGHPSVTLGLSGSTAHHRLPGDAATTRELQLALAGEPPGCRGIVDLVLDATVPEAVSWGENGVVAGFLAF